MFQLRVKHGEEGPTYDPYSYEQWEIRRNNQVILGHFGLLEWVKIGPSKKELTRVASGDDAVPEFEKLVGMSLSQLRKAYDHIHHSCKRCGCRRTRTVHGYPGEYLNICVRCDNVVSADFNKSEIL